MRSNRNWSGLLLGLLAVAFVSSAWAVPPSPELLEKLHRDLSIQTYYLQHEQELRAQGVESPNQMRLTMDQLQQILDTDFNMLAILVDFSDHTSRTSGSYFDNLLFGTGTGTVRDYYQQVTYGNLTVATINLPSALGWNRMPQTYTYYVNAQNGFGAYPRNAQKLAEDAVAAVAGRVDYSQYDNNHDGYVDALFVIHSGSGAEYTGSNSDIWSHKWSLYFPASYNGVIIRDYSMEPEYWSTGGDMTCGVFCHEMGHDVFGFPDLYDTDNTSEGLGNWSLMAGGSWNGSLGNSPAHPDAWCRIYMGAATATNVTTNLTGAAIPAVETTPTIYRLWTGGASGSQYFLVENRQRTGYDAALPNTGLLIYHVDNAQSGNANEWYPGHTSSGHYKVALEQADNLWDLERGMDRGDTGDSYPGSTNNRTFNDTSAPNSRSYAGTSTNVAVQNISASAATMTADLMVATGPVTPSLTVTAPNGGESWAVGGTRAITWTSSNLTENVAIELDRSYPSGTWETVVASTANSGTYNWVVSGATTTAARVRIHGVTQTAVGDTSNASFAITAAPPAGTLTVLAPNGGEVYAKNTTQTIRWSSTNLTGTVNIQLNRTYPTGAWETVVSSASNTGSYSWRIRTTATAPRIRIRSNTQPAVGDTSDANFTIRARSGSSEFEPDVAVPEHAMVNNYPNPFNPTTTIHYAIPAAGDVKLVVYDLEGREVAVLVNGAQAAGSYSVAWDGSKMASGVYFYKLTTGNEVLIHRMLLLK